VLLGAASEPFWSAFLKGLVKRGLKGVKLVISDAHYGLRLAITRVLGATWQRCRVHWMRNALAHVQKGQHTMVAAAIRQAFLQADAEAAHQPGSMSPISCGRAGPSSPS
jgi:transposase-like protein